MKTAMQEVEILISSRIEQADDELKNKLNFFHSWIVIHGINKERQQIEDAFNIGYSECEDDNGVQDDKPIEKCSNASDYYNKTYNQ